MQHDSNTLLWIARGVCIVATILILVRITMHEMKLERVLLLTVVEFILFFVPFPFLFFKDSSIPVFICLLLSWMGVVFLTTYVCFSYGLTDSRILLINIHFVCFFIGSCAFCFVDGTSPVFVACGGLLLYLIVVGVMDAERERDILFSVITSCFAFFGYWVLVVLWSVVLTGSHFQWSLFGVSFIASVLVGIISAALCAKENTPFPSRSLPLLFLFLGSCYTAVMPFLYTDKYNDLLWYTMFSPLFPIFMLVFCTASCSSSSSPSN